ncbi:HypC/HybG/HupF family hydrogenase formation chaperone [Caldichromatium japonicum]|uniref:HypC/HybG/HupF family hydrogenase formation chaperone n=1 Tax=Caldichromatium japonicum TaxID=2699430 RepID=A0A6G7VD27_9GAMM|nr:HypC/HybG/HupF family hydrogenase formation chaperone [Caldichromatium japonicum]QIK37874.1 HypC/HybG/HupF family hydrogenase formation chaperone [Caldichromatium japonicum]
MCLAIPARIVQMNRIDPAIDTAVVELGGVLREVSIALVPEAEVGDYVLVHVGYAISKIDPQEAEETLRLMAEMACLLEPESQAQTTDD